MLLIFGMSIAACSNRISNNDTINNDPILQQEANIEKTKNLLQPFLFSYYELENSILVDEYIYAHGDSKDSVLLSRLLWDNNYRIFLYLTNYSCLSCIDKQFAILSDSSRHSIVKNMVITLANSTYRPIYILLKKHHLTIPIYQTYNNVIGIDSDKHPGPMYFITDSTLEIRMLFPAIQLDDIYIEKYFNELEQRFLSKCVF